MPSSCTVALPVDLPDTRRLVFLNTEMVADVLDHRAIDVRKDVRTSVVQRIVEVKKPDRRRGFQYHQAISAT